MRNLLITIGAPGSGKSTWISENGLKPFTIEPDDIRLKIQSPVLNLDGTETISSKNDGRVWELVFEFLEERMKRGEFIVIDATHSSSKLINRYRQLAKNYRYRVTGINFKDIPLETILERNKNRLQTETPYKYVPEEAIKRIYARLQGTKAPGWIEEIRPEDFHDWYIKNNEPRDFNEYSRILIYGDIHGCFNEFQKVLDKTKPTENDYSIYLGDYFDRFHTEEELYKTFEHLKNTDPKKTLLLTGNHELHFRYFRQYVQLKEDIKFNEDRKEALIKEREEYEELNYDFLFTISSDYILEDKRNLTQEELSEVFKTLGNRFLTDYFDLDKLAEENLDLKNLVVEYYRKSKKLIQLDKKIKKIDTTLELLYDEYNKSIRNKVPKDTRKVFHLLYTKYGRNEVLELYGRMAQRGYIEFQNKKYVFTHGGINTTPNIFLATETMIKGVGTYGDEKKLAEIWNEKLPKDHYQFHGHRNIYKEDPDYGIKNNRSFNLNGDAEFGGNGELRAAIISENGIEIIQEKSTKERPAEHYEWESKLIEKELKKDQEYLAKYGILETARRHKGIHVKLVKPEENIYAINFTNSVFKTGKFDKLSIHARGLFVQELEDGERIIARGFHKFFNLNERPETKISNLNNSDIYPLEVREKANGYLGLLSAYIDEKGNKKWHVSSKTSYEGEFAKVFNEMIQDYLTEELHEIIIKYNITIAFEVIHPQFDPHIQEYFKTELIILDCIKNTIEFELDYQAKKEILSYFIYKFKSNEDKFIKVRNAKLKARINSYEDFLKFIKDENNFQAFDIENYIEGYVFKQLDNISPFMFKMKTDWYKFWKYMRSTLEKIQKLKELKDENKQWEHRIPELAQQFRKYEDIEVFNYLINKLKKDEFNFSNIIEVRKSFFKERLPELKNR